MATSPGWRAILLANVLIVVGILTFSTGFFPYKPLLPGLATFEEADSDITPIFDKVIFMVVDALRRYVLCSSISAFGRLKRDLVILFTRMNPGSCSPKGWTQSLF